MVVLDIKSPDDNDPGKVYLAIWRQGYRIVCWLDDESVVRADGYAKLAGAIA